jgi:phosphoglycolate phosphatase-like HAD superfamily hydrolase
VRKALREYAIDPAEAVYVGDAMSDYTAARSNCVRFIARVSGSQALFDGIDCVKLKDLKGLEEAIRGL